MASDVLNFNIGILGHVDSGKTSLAKALSTVASTACFDKNPQSKERGITLDLGFSSFQVDIPEQLKETRFSKLQFTLVDCPGHASLIRTIIGGAQIIDMMMLVIDVTKGMQTQTAECLVIGEVTCSKMIVVLNKVDMFEEAKREASVEKMTKRILKTLENTVFAGSPVVAVAARPGASEDASVPSVGISKLMETMKSQAYLPKRDPSGPFIFSVDHCFSIRGQGTVMTGTVVSGRVTVGDTVEIPMLKESRKVKSMQVFKKPVESAKQGDRLGLCVTQFDAKELERGLVCSPGALPTIVAALISVHKIAYYKGTISSRSKLHVSIGHDTVMAKVHFFGLYSDCITSVAVEDKFDFSKEYLDQEELLSLSSKKNGGEESKENIPEGGQPSMPVAQYALLEFESPVACSTNSLVIGAKLDMDIHTTACRLAFQGRLLHGITDVKYAETVLPLLRVYVKKSKEGFVERKADDYTLVCKGLFKKETNIELFVGLKVKLSTGEDGIIEGGFGQSGKFKVRIPAGIQDAAQQLLGGKGKKSKGKSAAPETEEASIDPASNIKVVLNFKKYIFDPKKKMLQS